MFRPFFRPCAVWVFYLFGTVFLLSTTSFASSGKPWQAQELADIWMEIGQEISILRDQHVPSPQGAQAISRALQKVFLPHSPLVALANVNFQGKLGEYLKLISHWQSIANYTLGLVMHYDDRILVKMQAVGDFYRYLAQHEAFYGLVRDFQFDKLQNDLGLTSKQLARLAPANIFVGDETLSELENFSSPATLALAQQTWQTTAQTILQEYLQREEVMTFESLPSVLGPAAQGPRYSNLRLMKDAITDQYPFSLNLMRATNCQALPMAQIKDPAVKTWLIFVNEVLDALKKYVFKNGTSLGQKFDRVNLVFDFAVPAETSLTKTSPSSLPNELQDLVHTKLFSVVHGDKKHLTQTQVVQLHFNLYLAAKAAIHLIGNRQIARRLLAELDASAPGGTTLFARLQQYDLDPRHRVDEERKLVALEACAKNIQK